MYKGGSVREETIKIHYRPQLKNPYLVAAWPGMGHVALRAAIYLQEKLSAREFAEISGARFFYPTAAIIKDSCVLIPQFSKGRFYYWKNKKGDNDLIIFICDLQPTIEKDYEYAQRVLDVAEEFGVKKVFTFAAMPIPIDHTARPGVWGVATRGDLLHDFKQLGVKIMGEGQISGLNGLLLAAAKERDLEGICLLGELPLYTVQIENPKTSLAVLKVLAQFLNLEIDFQELSLQAEKVERDIDKLVELYKPLDEKEAEKIKKLLATLTKLPESAKEEIERLFKEAQKDVSKAKELKEKLDRWGIFKEYEDRFLDIFKKEEKNNH